MEYEVMFKAREQSPWSVERFDDEKEAMDFARRTGKSAAVVEVYRKARVGYIKVLEICSGR